MFISLFIFRCAGNQKSNNLDQFIWLLCFQDKNLFNYSNVPTNKQKKIASEYYFTFCFFFFFLRCISLTNLTNSEPHLAYTVNGNSCFLMGSIILLLPAGSMPDTAFVPICQCFVTCLWHYIFIMDIQKASMLLEWSCNLMGEDAIKTIYLFVYWFIRVHDLCFL